MFVCFFFFGCWMYQCGIEYYLVVYLLGVVGWCVFDDVCGYWIVVMGVVFYWFVVFFIVDDYLVLWFFDYVVLVG